MSTAVIRPVVVASRVATATIVISLDDIDWTLVQKYGPVTVDVGGTFGLVEMPPDGYDIDARDVDISYGTVIKQSVEADTPAHSVAIAVEWAEEVVTRITAAMTAMRDEADDVVENTATAYNI